MSQAWILDASSPFLRFVQHIADALRSLLVRVLLFDPTCLRARGRAGLSPFWHAGAVLYGPILQRIDAARAATSWSEALAWLARVRPHEPIDELQYWGHGKWGQVFIDDDALDVSALSPGSPLYAPLRAVADRMRGPESLLWFRTCELFGAERGHDFARRFSDAMRCRIAGHTRRIGFWQSGLHSIAPGEAPSWSAREGLSSGTPAAPLAATGSSPTMERTIHCLQGSIPRGW